MKLTQWMWIVLGAAAILTSSCNGTERTGSSVARAGLFAAPRVTVPAGTTLEVELAQTLSSETAHRGDAWRGVVTNTVIVNGKEVIPAGSAVVGVVTVAEEARQGSRARLGLGVRQVRIGNRKIEVRGDADPVTAGSTRARNLGAITAGAAAGALLGSAFGNGDDATKGAILGGAVATGAVAASKGYQVVLKDGSVRSFSVREDILVAMR